MSDTPDRYPGQLTRVDAFAIAAMVLGVVALALSIPALLVASNARDNQAAHRPRRQLPDPQ
jgi:hypothetical protein